MNVITGREDLTLVNIADRLLDTGIVVDGEATISVADVDLVWLGLNLALTSVDRIRDERASGGLARNVPSGPGTMSARMYREGSSEDPAPPVRASQRVIERSEAAQAGEPQGELDERDKQARLRADMPERVNVDPDEVEKGLAKLVLTIVEFIRQLLERQAVRRMERGSLTDEEVERIGLALERLDRKLGEMAARFGLAREDLSLRLGPLGELV